MDKTILGWSGGKDSAMALHALVRSDTLEPCALLTTVTREYDRISMHGVRRDLLEEQARCLALPLHVVEISSGGGEEEYSERMGSAFSHWYDRGVKTAAFGDIHLVDVRAYREAMVGEIPMKAAFPLWGSDPAELARTFIAEGFRAVVSVVDGHVLPRSFAGRSFNETFLADLPATVDPCGEKGEFHTFVTGGPIFETPLTCKVGDVVTREGRFHFCDLTAC
ncbi:MAG: Dph6-related ATP pyrophosphatase [Planctomycetota bacterium]|jgi:uncharacterized protein (TIGR00290 family)